MHRSNSHTARAIIFSVMGCLFTTISAAQSPLEPPLAIGLSVNESEHPVLYSGWPALASVNVMLDQESGVSGIALTHDWTSGLHIVVKDTSGATVPWPFHLVNSPSEVIILDSITYAVAAFWISPDELQSVPAGDFLLTAVLDSTAYATGTWPSLQIESPSLKVRVVASPDTFGIAGIEQRNLLLANLHILQGDDAGAESYVDTILGHDGQNIKALALSGSLREESGDLGGARHAYAAGAASFYSKNPNSPEPPAELLNMQRALEYKLDTLTSFVVSLTAKDSAHPLYGHGGVSCYAVDNVLFREMEFTRGKTYTFHMSNIPPAESFYFTTSFAGGGSAPYTAGVSGTPADSNDVVTISVGAGTPDTLYYQSMGDQYVGWRINVMDSATITGAAANSSTRPLQYVLHEAYPNPFNPATTIRYDLPERTRVRIVIYDILGREVTTLVNNLEEAGYKSAIWNPANAPSGVYFYRIQAGTFTATKKVILLR